MRRIFEPDAGDATLVCVSTDERTWERELRDFEAEKQERDTVRLMTQRTSVCG
jgi:hypothetical protein